MGHFCQIIIYAGMPKGQPKLEYIENSAWKVLEYGIYTRVVFVSEIERVSATNEWDLLYTHWDIHHFGGLFILQGRPGGREGGGSGIPVYPKKFAKIPKNT